MSKIVKLKNITKKIGSGSTPTGGSNVYLDKGVAFIRSQNVLDMKFSLSGLVFIDDVEADKLKGVTVEKSDVLLNITGDSIARTCVIPSEVLPARVSQHVSIIRCKDKESSQYINYYLQHLKSYLLQICKVGGTRNALTKDAIENLDINFPLDHKSRAAVLSVLDAKIACNNRINAELEAMAKTLYDYWFVQFNFPYDFAQGKPATNGKPYRTSGGKMTYNPTLKREIPAGWESGPLSEWIACNKTGDWGKESIEGNYTLQVDCIRGTDINGLNGSGGVAAPTRFILEKNSGKILAPFDFVIEISGGSPTQSTGRMAFVLPETINRFSHPIICSNFCKAISLKDNAYFFNFAYEWQSAYDNKILFGWEGKTSGIKNLLFDAFVSKYDVCKPPQKLAHRFFEFVSPLQIQKQKLLKQNDEFTQLRDWLLPMLMNGQVTVA